jgi:uncharacterized protein (DUF362 family)
MTRHSIPVALASCDEYSAADLDRTVGLLLQTIGCRPVSGTRALVKPNLLAPTPPHYLPCTHPLIVRAVCKYLISLGAEVKLGDSPTFGRGIDIASQIGLAKAVEDLPVTLVNLDRPKITRLPFRGWAPISRIALENDLIVSVSKLKAHHQTRVTGAVKNVYGCVTGLRKPILHLLKGDGGNFEKMLLGIWGCLPPNVSVMDAITAMHIHGPTNGSPYHLGLLAASPSPVALDTAVMSILRLQPQDAPLWQTALDLDLPGARLEDLIYPLRPPESFDATGFQTPAHLFPISFRPLKVAVHLIKRFMAGRSWQVKSTNL